MDCFDVPATPVETITDPYLHGIPISLSIKRDDLNHPDIMGNKLRKLKYNIRGAYQQGATTLLSFGGAWSNHLLALSAAGRLNNMQTIGIIRGDELAQQPLNPVLARASENGMQLHFVSRAEYKHRHDAAYTDTLRDQFGDFYLLPEGGSNTLAIKGVAELIDELDQPYDVIACACGTGGTLAGIIDGIAGRDWQHTRAIGFAVLKGEDMIADNIRQWLPADITGRIDWKINTDYHFGGYAKTNPALFDFMRGFQQRTGIALDTIYTGKLMFGLYNLIERGHFPDNCRVLAIHSGGTQTALISSDQP